jgi:hypothetical protein
MKLSEYNRLQRWYIQFINLSQADTNFKKKVFYPGAPEFIPGLNSGVRVSRSSVFCKYILESNILPRLSSFACATILNEFSCAYATPEMLYLNVIHLYVINEADHIAVPAPIRILLSTQHFKRLLRRVKAWENQTAFLICIRRHIKNKMTSMRL